MAHPVKALLRCADGPRVIKSRSGPQEDMQLGLPGDKRFSVGRTKIRSRTALPLRIFYSCRILTRSAVLGLIDFALEAGFSTQTSLFYGVERIYWNNFSERRQHKTHQQPPPVKRAPAAPAVEPSCRSCLRWCDSRTAP